jgi:hypothetical protein
MAARRDRERRRPSGESRYRFAAPESAVDSGEVATGDETTTPEAETSADRQSRARRTATPAARQATVAPTRGGARPAPLPFSAYATEYRYVISDLRRVGLVIGSLLVILILLYFVLPH